jgi:predicted small integral membrane protein
MQRAMSQPSWHTAFYLTIIVWESVTMILYWWGGLHLARSLREEAAAFRQARSIANAGLTLGLWM